MTTINTSVYDTTINSSVGNYTVNVSIGTSVASLSYISSDTLLSLEGASGDTGIKYNSTSQKIEVYVNNVKVAEF